MDDPELALRIPADHKVEGCIPLVVPGAVRNRPSEWLIDHKPIPLSRPLDYCLSSGRPLSDRPLTMVLLRGGFHRRGINQASSVKADPIRKISSLHRRIIARHGSQISENKLF